MHLTSVFMKRHSGFSTSPDVDRILIKAKCNCSLPYLIYMLSGQERDKICIIFFQSHTLSNIYFHHNYFSCFLQFLGSLSRLYPTAQFDLLWNLKICQVKFLRDSSVRDLKIYAGIFFSNIVTISVSFYRSVSDDYATRDLWSKGVNATGIILA